MCVPFMGTRLTSRVTREEGAARKKMDQMYGPLRWGGLERATLSLDANDAPRTYNFSLFLSFSSSSSFFFFFLSSSFCTINLPAGRGQERILFVSAHRRLIIEAKFPQITMKHGVINVRCVRDDRVIYTCRTHLATDWPCRVVRLRTLPLVRDRILNFTRFVSRLDLAAAFKFE